MTENKTVRTEYPPLTPELIAAGLRDVGLKRGDLVFVHSSLKDLAPARQMLSLPEMGMPYVIQALEEVLGPEGLSVFPTFSFCFGKSKYGPTGTIWDKRTAPSRVGDITNYFLSRRGVKRSDHPTHSVAALGTRAGEFVAGHAWDAGSTFHPGSPWGRLCEWDGYILFLGTYLRTCTMVHAVEDWMKLPYLSDAEAVIKDGNGDIRFVTVTGSPVGCRDFYNFRNTKSERAFLSTGIYRAGKVCMADVFLFKARDFVRFLWQAILNDPWLLLHRDQKDEFCWNAGLATEKHIASFRDPCPF
jgi:aminoglycoside 3-N-acetyltransferase